MATEFPIQVEIDIAEPRILLDGLVVTAGGRADRQAWDESISTNIWRDPIKGFAMLAPLPTTPEWRTTTTGNYARLAKANYTLTTSAAWVENHRGVSGNIYLEGNGTNELVKTAASYDADQPWFLSVYVPGVESLGEQTILECGWGNPGASTTISLRFRANGRVAVYRGSTQIGYQDLDYGAGKGVDKSLGLTTVNILLLPVRRVNPDGDTYAGELMIITDAMTGYINGFDGLGNSDAIVPAGVFWWQVPIGRPSVLCAPVKFPTSGTLYGPLQTLRYAPNTPRTFTGRGFYSTIGATPSATYSLVNSAGSAYTPDGTTTQVRGKVSLSGDGTETVCVEAVDWVMSPSVTDTDDSELVDITTAIDDIELVLDEQGEASCTIKVRKGMIADLGVEGFIEHSDRPFRIFIVHPDTSVQTDLMRGVLNSPTWEPAQGLGDGDYDILTYTGRDRMAELAYYQYGDTVADDGKLLTDAFSDVLTGCGFDAADLVISTDTTLVPMSRDIPAGTWTLLPQRGQTRAEHLSDLFDRFAANWWRGWIPGTTYKWRAIAPADLSTTPAVTLYSSLSDALAAGLTAAQAPHRSIYNITRSAIAPEANQVIVIGQSASGLILSQSNATSSQTPTTAPSARPVTWRGRIHRVVEIDPTIGTQAEADYVRDTLAGRIASERYMADISCPALFVFSDANPLWRGGVIRLYAPGRATYEDWRVLSIPRFVMPKMVTDALYDTGERPHYEATYRCERIAVGP